MEKEQKPRTTIRIKPLVLTGISVAVILIAALIPRLVFRIEDRALLQGYQTVAPQGGRLGFEDEEYYAQALRLLSDPIATYDVLEDDIQTRTFEIALKEMYSYADAGYFTYELVELSIEAYYEAEAEGLEPYCYGYSNEAVGAAFEIVGLSVYDAYTGGERLSFTVDLTTEKLLQMNIQLPGWWDGIFDTYSLYELSEAYLVDLGLWDYEWEWVEQVYTYDDSIHLGGYRQCDELNLRMEFNGSMYDYDGGYTTLGIMVLPSWLLETLQMSEEQPADDFEDIHDPEAESVIW